MSVSRCRVAGSRAERSAPIPLGGPSSRDVRVPSPRGCGSGETRDRDSSPPPEERHPVASMFATSCGGGRFAERGSGQPHGEPLGERRLRGERGVRGGVPLLSHLRGAPCSAGSFMDSDLPPLSVGNDRLSAEIAFFLGWQRASTPHFLISPPICVKSRGGSELSDFSTKAYDRRFVISGPIGRKPGAKSAAESVPDSSE
jgi:hypothetical protein